MKDHIHISGESIVETASGRLRGRIEEGIHVFRGIRYGIDTGGRARLRRSHRPPAWAGVKDALQFAPMCPQLGMFSPGDTEVLQLLSGGFEIPSLAPDEDCLALNIWTPHPHDGRRPVMVWCHGGRFTEGSGGNAWCDGAALASRGDVVVVTLNHRLNIFGHLYLPDLVANGGTDAHAWADSGNIGLLDIVSALEWIRDHIARFGGDTGNVTLFGNSGGGAKISALMTMPIARGLFHKAIVQSAPLHGAAGTAHRQTRIAEEILAALDLPPGNLEHLAELPVAQLQDAMRIVDAQMAALGSMGIFVPTVDGEILPEHPFVAGAPACCDAIPLLIGSNADEMTLLLGSMAMPSGPAELLQALRQWPGVDTVAARHLLEIYRDRHPAAGAADLFLAIASDYAVRNSIVTQAEYKSRQSAPVYTYLFRWRVPAFQGRYGAMHGAEVPFVFGNMDKAPGFEANPDQYRTLQDKVMAAWVAFARHGNPNHAALPHWPSYDPSTRATLCFGEARGSGRGTGNACEVVLDPDREARLFIRALADRSSTDH